MFAGIILCLCCSHAAYSQVVNENLQDITSELFKSSDQQYSIQAKYGVKATIEEPRFNTSGNLRVNLDPNLDYVIGIVTRDITPNSNQSCGNLKVEVINDEKSSPSVSQADSQLIVKCDQEKINKVHVFKIPQAYKYSITFEAPSVENKDLEAVTRLVLIPAIFKPPDGCPADFSRIFWNMDVLKHPLCIHPYPAENLQLIKKSIIYSSVIDNYSSKETNYTKIVLIVGFLIVTLIFVVPTISHYLWKRSRTQSTDESANNDPPYAGVPLEEVSNGIET